MEEQKNIETENSKQEVKPNSSPSGRSGGVASLLSKFDSAGESGLMRVLLNLPFVLFLVLLGVARIANNHLAENYARRITKTEKEVKQLRWQYMTTASALMQKSKQSEVAKLVNAQGLKELRIPPYKIETKTND